MAVDYTIRYRGELATSQLLSSLLSEVQTLYKLGLITAIQTRTLSIAGPTQRFNHENMTRRQLITRNYARVGKYNLIRKVLALIK